MSYKLETKYSPNYTPGSQAQYFYGQPRTIKFGAGHWWGDPNAGYSHQGVVNTFMNPARQASAHAVISFNRVTRMVRTGDISWATNNANPYTVSIELKPNMTAGDKETCAEYIADMGWHNLTWYPHRRWWNTACNPLPWGEIMQRAKQIHAAKNNPQPKPEPKPKPVVAEWTKNLVTIKPVKLMVLQSEGTTVFNLNTMKPITKLAKGTWVDIAKKTTVKGREYLISNYSAANSMPNGIPSSDLGIPAEKPQVEKPEWLKNWRDIEDEVMYTRIDAPLVDLLTGKTIKTIPINTAVEIASATTWHGKEFLITKYSTGKQESRGIALVDLDKKPIVDPGKPAEPAPKQPSLEERVSIIESIMKAITVFLDKIHKGWR